MCKWIVDADQLDSSDFSKTILYRNALVDSYVFDERKFGIGAPKGLGKTFLLKSKRIESQSKGILCLPIDTMLDVMDKVTFEDSLHKYMLDYSNWVDIWKAAICISIIKNVFKCDESGRESVSELLRDSNTFFADIYNSDLINSTCQIVNKILNSHRSAVRALQIQIPDFIAVVKKCRRPIHIFIDKTDQALRDQIQHIAGASGMSHGPSNSSCWLYGQLALAEASYLLFTQNAHIKVYYSIRSEALVGAEGVTDLFLQVNSYITRLKYDHDELRRMFVHYIAIEDDKWLVDPHTRFDNPDNAFIGQSIIQHGYVRNRSNEYVQELFFDYMYRHTLKRPRDIMHICYRLCYAHIGDTENGESRVRVIRHIVNQESRLLLQSYWREMTPFCFEGSEKGWELFWSAIDTNVFSSEYIWRRCEYLNNAIDETDPKKCVKKCCTCELFKPFAQLYNTGLLGVLSRNNVDGENPHIRFMDTGDALISNNEVMLPESNLYFLHPMMTNKIEASRNDMNLGFDICRQIIVGDGIQVLDEIVRKIKKKETDRENSTRKKTIFLSSTCHDMADCRSVIYSSLGRYGYRVVMSENNDFGMPNDEINSYDYCLDKVCECSSLIYVIGERFGGPYKGIKYLSAAEEIERLNPRIGEPSISLMEFYIAKRKCIPTYVFTRKEIYNERNTYNKNMNNQAFIPAYVKSTKVFETITLITNLDTGNWFKSYEDLDDLLEILKIQFGNI